MRAVQCHDSPCRVVYLDFFSPYMTRKVLYDPASTIIMTVILDTYLETINRPARTARCEVSVQEPTIFETFRCVTSLLEYRLDHRSYIFVAVVQF